MRAIKQIGFPGLYECVLRSSSSRLNIYVRKRIAVYLMPIFLFLRYPMKYTQSRFHAIAENINVLTRTQTPTYV